MKYYLVAGERSGDLHASNLMKQLILKDNNASFRYFGGDYMAAVGGNLVVHYANLAFMGLFEVISNFRKISNYINQCKQDIEQWQPDAVILVDYAGFNLRIAKFAKAKGIKVIYYISPKVWAWNQKRAHKIKKLVDHMYVILPFEVDFYKKFDWLVTYVGNPVVESVANYEVISDFRGEHGLGDKSIIAMLPGSRKQEVKKLLPIMATVADEYPNHQICVACVRSLPAQFYQGIALKPNVKLVFDQTYDLLANAKGAIVCSGTATLETALWDVPQVVVYKGMWLSYKIAMLVIKVKFISLVNLIMDKEVVTELIQNDFNKKRLKKEMDRILDPTVRSKIFLDYYELEKALGGKGASKKAAELIFNALNSTD